MLFEDYGGDINHETSNNMLKTLNPIVEYVFLYNIHLNAN